MTDPNQNKSRNPTPQKPPVAAPVKEVGGYKGQNPTEHGDWQHKGRVTDF